MSDLIERLKTERSVYDAELCDEAITEIEELRECEMDLLKRLDKAEDEIERLRDALKEIRNFSRPEVRETQSPGTIRGNMRSIDRIAREALEDSDG